MPNLSGRNAKITVALGPAGSQITWPSTLKLWTTYEGGDPVAATSQLLPGGTINGKAMPGAVTRTNVTVTAPYTTDIDALRARINAMLNQAMSVSFVPTDGDGNVNGTGETVTGLFKGPQWPKGDPKGESMMFGLVMECDA